MKNQKIFLLLKALKRFLRIKLKIGIIGYGAVGKACSEGFISLGHSIILHDTKLKTKIDDLFEANIIFICVPTPVDEDGSCDTSIVESCVEDLKSISYNGIICIKSTVEPGTTINLSKKYDLDLCFVPEFLRERCALEDFLNNHDLLAVGTENLDSQKIIIEAHGNLPKNIKLLTPTEAELLKYFCNSYNALKVIFANNFFEIASHFEADYKNVLDSFLQRNIKNDDYLSVNENLRGYGGVCLPKDVKALVALTKKLNISLKLFQAIDRDNKMLETTVFEGMRKK